MAPDSKQPVPQLADPELRLFSNVCSGNATTEELAQFEKLLRDNPAARVVYLQYAAMHADLFGAVRLERTRQLVETELTVPTPTYSPPVANWSAVLRGVVALATAAALFVAIYFAQSLGTGDREVATLGSGKPLEVIRFPGAVATIERLENVVWKSQDNAFAIDQYMVAEDVLAIESGRVKIAFRQGVIAVLEGPGELVVHNENHATLRRGDLAAVAPAWAVGFRVDTPKLHVIDHGTKFLVSVGNGADDSEVKVVVAEGEVEVFKPQQQATSQRLLTGDGVRTEGDLLTTDKPSDDDHRLTATLPSPLKRGQAVVVGDRWHDWRPGVPDQPRREGAWRYFANSGGPFGDIDSYLELTWNERGFYCPLGNVPGRAPGALEFVRVHRDGGHPGRGSQQNGNGLDIYSIAAFTVPTDGRYSIEAGWLERPETKVWDERQMLDVSIHVNSEPVTSQFILGRNCYMTFATDLGELVAGDTIYAGVGPSGYAYNDRFRWGFYIVRELTSGERGKH